MKKIQLDDILPLDKYRTERNKFRERVLFVKESRRIGLGPYLNFLFENRETMLYQIQEMIHIENITEPRLVQHEIDTYNQMIPEKNELKATLLIEIENPDIRKVKLAELLGLHEELALCINRKHEISAQCDPTQIDEGKISSVQFLTFVLGEECTKDFLETETVEITTAHPACSYRSLLTAKQLAALKADIQAE